MFLFILSENTQIAQRLLTASNFFLVGVLVIVTIFYVIRTADIAKGTKIQAEAMTKQAEAAAKQVEAVRASVAEMREQRQLSTQPWVFPNLVYNEGRTVNPQIYLENVGNGPAIKLKPFIGARPSEFEKTEPFAAFLKAGSNILWLVDPAHRLIPNKATVVAVEYQDIYGDTFKTGYVYEVAEERTGDISITPIKPLFPVKMREGKEK